MSDVVLESNSIVCQTRAWLFIESIIFSYQFVYRWSLSDVVINAEKTTNATDVSTTAVTDESNISREMTCKYLKLDFITLDLKANLAKVVLIKD